MFFLFCKISQKYLIWICFHTMFRLLSSSLRKGEFLSLIRSQGVSELSRTYSTKTYGNLADEDRIFTNLYREYDVGIEGAMKRVCDLHDK